MTGLEPLYPAIGRVVASFAQLEGTVLLFVAGLIHAEPDITMALLSEASFSRRLDALKCVAPYRISDTHLLDELDAVIRRLSDSEAKRNAVVHTVWAVSGSGFMSFKPTARRKHGVQTNLKVATVGDIDAVGDNIRQSITALDEFMHKLQDRGVLKAKLTQTDKTPNQATPANSESIRSS